jgi:hypothetical protein
MDKSRILRMSNKYTRSNFFMSQNNEQTTLKNVEDYDLSTSYFYLFETKFPIREYQIERKDTGRPDMISYKAYKTMDHWWIILKYNDILDLFDEFVENKIIKIPDLRDIQDWYSKVKKKKEKDDARRKQDNLQQKR